MALSTELISQFVKATKDEPESKKETTVYGTIVTHNGRQYVKLDGSELLTPISTTANVLSGERVTVMIKNHTATVTGNISSPAARVGDVSDIRDAASKIVEFEILLSDKVDTKTLNAETARIDALVSDNVAIKETLSANEAVIGELQASNVTINETLTANTADINTLKTDMLTVTVADAKYATIENLNATNADLYNLEATYGDFTSLTASKFEAVEADIADLEAKKISAAAADIKYATVDNLKVEQARIDDLEAEVGDIDTLIFGSATGSTIQTSFANAVIAQLGDAQIKSAMIDTVSASKINAGDINTNAVRVVSEDGKLLISDETIQISDDTRVRVQIGKDSSGDYSISIWDADGNLMFSEGGITDSAIKEAIIRNDMVSDTANIAAHKLDIDSLFEEINGSTKTIKSSRVYLDEENQTLDMAFETLSTDLTELQNGVTSQGTQISAIQGQITSKVWQTDIDTASETLSTQYSELDQQLNSVKATVANHTSQISEKADASTVTTVNDRVTTLEANMSGFQSTVSNTYSTTEQMNSAITQSANSITSSVSATYTTKTEFANLEVGGRNLIAGTNETREYMGNITDGGNGTYIDVWTGKTIDIPTDSSYVVSFDAKADVEQTITCYFYSPNTTLTAASSTGQYKTSAGDGGVQVSITTEWKRYWVKWTQTAADTRKSIIVGRNFTENDIYIRAVKLEVGNTPTDWTLAPEDMATADALETVESSADLVETRVSTAETLIQQLSSSIAMLVTDGNGESLMTQTESGWTFSTGEIQDIVDATSENLDTLTNEVGDINSTVGILQQAVDDLGILTDYVKITTYENEPCIELGETDSDFKLLITNTRIMFMEGTGVPAYINNQSLFIKNAIVEEELQQGEFVWKVRNNGNLGLIWKGATS